MAAAMLLPAIGSQIVLGVYAKFSKKPYIPLRNDNYMPSLSVIIPAWNEGKRIQYALASLDMQTYPIEKVYVIDDGSTDNTYEIIEKMRFVVKNLDIEPIRHEKSIGKTPGVKFATRHATTEKIMVLDADTILSDPDYIKKTIAPHFDPLTASSYGTVRPFSRKEQLNTLMKLLIINHEDYGIKIIKENIKALREAKKQDWKYYLLQWPVERYREALYLTDQYFSKDSALRLYNTTLFPIGCGVIYDRIILRDIFDYYERKLGDNLTTSEDIFIGFSIVARGYNNVQVPSAHMISAEPRVDRLPRQLFLWSSSFLQSAFYFKKMTFTFTDHKKNPTEPEPKETEKAEPKKETEEKTEPTTTETIKDAKDTKEMADIRTTRTTRPFGWIIFFPIFEKITYPLMIILLVMLDYRYAILSVLIEYLVYITIMRFSAPRMPKMHFIKICLVSLPLRFINLMLDIKITVLFIKDLITGKRDWRK